jgi:hypothetical protein
LREPPLTGVLARPRALRRPGCSSIRLDCCLALGLGCSRGFGSRLLSLFLAGCKPPSPTDPSAAPLAAVAADAQPTRCASRLSSCIRARKRSLLSYLPGVPCFLACGRACAAAQIPTQRRSGCHNRAKEQSRDRAPVHGRAHAPVTPTGTWPGGHWGLASISPGASGGTQPCPGTKSWYAAQRAAPSGTHPFVADTSPGPHAVGWPEAGTGPRSSTCFVPALRPRLNAGR